jgi:membrane associated rhomboid family serine protease
VSVVIFRSASLTACEERVLVLRAVGIAGELARAGRDWSLEVDESREFEARLQLDAFARENRPRPERSLPVRRPHAWIGATAYAVLLVTLAWLASIGAFGRDWFAAGDLVAGLVRHGELWRTVTALGLHLDVAHLLSNIGFGALFGYFCAEWLGSGIAWGGILLGGALGNLISAWLHDAAHRAVGASTAVFAALGLLSAYGLHLRMTAGQSWAWRWGPLIAGVALLGFTGTSGERTDITAHAAGFVAGAVLGFLATRLPRSLLGNRRVQRSVGAVTLGVVVLAWFRALSG